jgi:very-short-patch-repair endonuclease
VPFGPYVLDFYCFDLRLAIELDGGQHNESLKDLVRDEFLAAKGITVMRFWNHDVLQNIEGVLLRLDEVLKKLPHPSPPLREGRE